jgi:uncharacterized protein (DUF433 family)
MSINIYDDEDPRVVPTYSVRQASSYLSLPYSTTRTWFFGAAAPIKADGKAPAPLSFWNLVECSVMATLRRRHEVPLQRIRKALAYVKRHTELERPLVEQDFLTDGLDLFIEQVGEIVNASRGGQTTLRDLLRDSLARVDRDPKGLVSRLYPWRDTPSDDPRDVEIDPTRAFGKLVIAGTGIPTAVIADRMRAGESIRSLARDYRLDASQIEAAVRWELGVATL